MVIKDFADKFRVLVGDSSKSIPDKMIIEALNLAFNKLASVPGLSRAFRKHYQINLNAKDGYKWKLEGDFRRLADIPMLNFYSQEKGGDPCPIMICPLDVISFYNKHGLVSMKQSGIPCEYTLEQEGDNTYLVLDRPSDIPLIVDYIAYGYPKPINGYEEPKTDKFGDIVKDKNGNIIMVPTEREISAVIEDCLLQSMKDAFYTEAEDLAFAGAMLDQLSNKYIPEAIQMLNKTLKVMPKVVLGG